MGHDLKNNRFGSCFYLERVVEYARGVFGVWGNARLEGSYVIMKLVWKLTIPQICVVVCFGLISYVVINSSFNSMRTQYVRDVIENRLRLIAKEIEIGSQKAVSETSVFVSLPTTIQAYEIALSGNVDDPRSPESQAARDFLRKEFAPMLDSYSNLMGKKLELHFHLPNGRSLVRLWRDYNTRVDGEWIDISDDISSFRPTVVNTNMTGEVSKGLEPGSGGFAIRGVVPVIAPDGRQLGSAETLQQFAPIMELATEEGKIFIALYANNELLDFSVELQDQERYPPIGDFVRVIEAKDDSVESHISAELLSKGKGGIFFENHGSRVLASCPLTDYQGKQVGVIVCAMNTTAISALVNTAAFVLALMLAGMAVVPTFALLIQLRMLVSRPLGMVRSMIQDLAEDRVNLSKPNLSHQKDEIGEFARWVYTLTIKLDGILRERRAMAHWYKSILDATPCSISVTDANMKWTFVNKAVEVFLGTTLEDMIGKPCSNWNTHICNTRDCGIARARRGLKRTYFTLNGRSLQADVEILKDINGKVAGFIEVVQDITDLEELHKKQAETEAASQAKTSFLANMSHEIRTPMNAILGVTEIQLLNESLDPGVREALEKIYASGDMLLGIINDILDFSKIEAGKQELVIAPYQIASLINDTAQLNMMRIGSKPIEFELCVSEDMPADMLGDELRVKQVLNNLLSNAFKYTEEGKVNLSVRTETLADNEDVVILVICISDTGQGMTKEQVEKLFDAYTRFNMDVNRATEGTGLGMSITNSLIRLMNGEIFIESEPGKGSAFTIRLPQGKCGTEVLGKEMAENLRQFRTNSRAQMKRVQITREPLPYGSVLIVDDVETNIYVATGLLSAYELKIDSANSGFVAIDKVKAGKQYDIIFMDHMMPKMDGVEATKVIRNLGYARPIVALTANAVSGQADMFLKNGFDDFVSKPIDIRQLNTVLNKWIRDKQSSEVAHGVKEAARNEDQPSENPPQPAIDPKLVKFFVQDASKALAILEVIVAKNDYSNEEDMRDYIVNVHGMKSVLAAMGRMDFSATAEKLEIAAREGKLEIITSETSAFVNALRVFVKELSPQED